MTMIRYPLPITSAMLALANQFAAYPRYAAPGATADWSGGVVGNPIDTGTANGSIANSSDAVNEVPYAPTTQTGKGAAMVPPMTPLVDIGKDYGPYAGQTGRTGAITPQAPYPDATSPPTLAAVAPATGGLLGGTSITITGQGLAGATGVTIGGTAATAVTVVNANTITATTPAKTAGAYDVVVTTPRGTNPAGTKFTYAP